MTPEDRTQIRDRIEAEIAQTRATIAAQEADGKGIAPDRAIGRVSRMDAMYNQQVNAGTLRRARERLVNLEYVLVHLDSPDFGRCEYCREPIQPARIMAMPESRICVRCASSSR